MRLLTSKELDLISFVLKDKHHMEATIRELPQLIVEEMNDRRMGSLRFQPKSGEKNVFGEQIAEIHLTDVDGSPLFITINLDKNGNIFELDIWKSDFSPLKQFPTYPYTYYTNNSE